MKKEIIVSVIVPVYNAEKYLSCLIDSLLKQTLKEMEFIFVNDGSKDESLNILEEYAKKDERIVIIDKKNAGVSAARNDGIRIAKGEFIGFADADDFVAENMYECLYTKAIEKNADIVSCGHIVYTPEKEIPKFSGHEAVMNREEAVKNLLNSKILGMSACTKLYRKEILKGVTFPENYRVNEDRFFTFKALKYAEKIAVIKEEFYYYRVNEESVSRSGFKPITMDALSISKEMHSTVKEEYPLLINVSYANIAVSAYFALTAMYKDDVCKKFSKEHKLLVSEIKKLNLKNVKPFVTKSIFIQLVGVKCCEPILRFIKKLMLRKKVN